MEFDKEKYIYELKNLYGEFDDDFKIHENENGEIESVFIRNKGVDDISKICECKTIKVLYLPNNNITSLLPLYNLSSIIKLNVSRNKIKFLFGIASNKNIESIDASNNEIGEEFSLYVGKELYEKEFIGKDAEYIREYFTK
jgi:Leucine-rich repeat (LRR) protein